MLFIKDEPICLANPGNIYLYKSTIETLEKDVKYVQNSQ